MLITKLKWQIVTNCSDEKKKSNFSSEFKLKLITTYSLKFVEKSVMKML